MFGAASGGSGRECINMDEDTDGSFADRGTVDFGKVDTMCVPCLISSAEEAFDRESTEAGRRSVAERYIHVILLSKTSLFPCSIGGSSHKPAGSMLSHG